MNLKLTEISKEELIKIIETLHADVTALKTEVNSLKEENKRLKAQISLNSSNSSLPPSLDGFKKKAKNNSLREKTDRKSGGQQNHKGYTLEKVDCPDIIVDIKNDTCPCCHENLENIDPITIDTRQVFDIPLPKIEVTEYRVHNKKCPNCNTVSNPQFPIEVSKSTSYGANIKSFVTYMSVQNHLPYNRIGLFLSDLFQCNISEGTIFNILNKAYENLSETEATIKENIVSSSQINVDETGFYVEHLRKWLFTYSTKKYTYYDFHEKRGKIAMDSANILGKFSGVATHDCWKPYEQFDNCSHSYCNAHFLRELNGIKETTDFIFPEIIKKTLLEMKKLIDSRNPISEEIRNDFIYRYASEIQAGFIEEAKANPPTNTKTGKQGRKKQSKAKNLLLRLAKIPEVLGFFNTPELIPFDNNLAERDIRMVKVKQKVSGLHRSNQGAKQFCRIRGYISTIVKNNLDIWESLKSIFLGNPIMP